jgi:hypothetical protein
MITVKLTKAPGNAREFVLEDDSDISQLFEQADIDVGNDDVILLNGEETSDDHELQDGNEVIVMVMPVFDSISGFDRNVLVRELNARFKAYHSTGIAYSPDAGYTILLEKIRED